MEFEEMKKIWDAQKQEHVFTINQSALHRRVLAKQNQGLHITNTSEWLLILVNIIASTFILFTTLSKEVVNISLMILAGWMFLTAAYVAYQRYRRIHGTAQFDRTLNGDLQFALDVARYQVRLSTLGRWNIVPLGILSITGLLEAHKPFWIVAALAVFLVITNYAAGLESNFYKRRLDELAGLKQKLDEAI